MSTTDLSVTRRLNKIKHASLGHTAVIQHILVSFSLSLLSSWISKYFFSTFFFVPWQNIPFKLNLCVCFLIFQLWKQIERLTDLCAIINYNSVKAWKEDLLTSSKRSIKRQSINSLIKLISKLYIVSWNWIKMNSQNVDFSPIHVVSISQFILKLNW